MEKQQKVEAIIASLPSGEEEQKQELEDTITPSEKQQLKTVELQTKKYDLATQLFGFQFKFWELSYCLYALEL